jgi:hypothetical protein
VRCTSRAIVNADQFNVRQMRNPWKGRSLAICATPVVAFLVEINVICYASLKTGSGPLNSTTPLALIALLTGVLLPVISIPALLAAIAGLRTKVDRGLNIGGIVLNTIYSLLLLPPLISLAELVISRPRQ